MAVHAVATAVCAPLSHKLRILVGAHQTRRAVSQSDRGPAPEREGGLERLPRAGGDTISVCNMRA